MSCSISRLFRPPRARSDNFFITFLTEEWKKMAGRRLPFVMMFRRWFSREPTFCLSWWYLEDDLVENLHFYIGKIRLNCSTTLSWTLDFDSNGPRFLIGPLLFFLSLLSMRINYHCQHFFPEFCCCLCSPTVGMSCKQVFIILFLKV